MSFQVKPFEEVVAMTKEKLDEVMTPLRVRAAKAKAEVICAKIEGDLISLEREIHEACANKDIDFEAIARKVDRYDLTERKLKQITKLVDQLFPRK